MKTPPRPCFVPETFLYVHVKHCGGDEWLATLRGTNLDMRVKAASSAFAVLDALSFWIERVDPSTTVFEFLGEEINRVVSTTVHTIGDAVIQDFPGWCWEGQYSLVDPSARTIDLYFLGYPGPLALFDKTLVFEDLAALWTYLETL